MRENDSHIWAFGLGLGSIGEAVRQGNRILHKASWRTIRQKNKGLKLSLAPVQELRFTASLLSLPTVWNTGYRRF